MPKSIGYLLPDLCEYENIVKGYHKSKHGKTYVHNMLTNKEFDLEKVLEKLQYDFLNGTYKTSEYTVFTIYEPKERIIYRLPYAPDRIAHHCIMNVVEEFWTNKIPNTSYSCIKHRGVEGAYKYMKKCLRDKENTKYCFKCDIRKFFPSVNHEVLKKVVARYIKDKDFLVILNEIIDSTDSFVEKAGIGKKGYNLPIGNYLSQYFANLIVSQVFIELRKKYPHLKIIIYMDDIVVLASNKSVLHSFKEDLIETLAKYDLCLKQNYQIFPVDKRGISFVGFVFFHDKIRLRKSIVKTILKLCNKYKENKITKSKFKASMSAYCGWLKRADTKGLCRKIYDITGVWYSSFQGKSTKITELKHKFATVCHINKHKKYCVLECIYNKRPIEVQTKNKRLIKNLLSYRRNTTNQKFNVICQFK